MWGTSILWIHGFGLNIQKNLWKAVFNPVIGYLAVLTGLYYIYCL